MNFTTTLLRLTVILAVAAIAGPARATTLIWTNTAGGNWNNTNNWNPNQLPTPTDDAVVTVGGTYTVTLNVSSTVNSLTVGGSSGQITLTNSSSTLTLNSASEISTNGVLGFSGGILNGGGMLTVDGLFTWTGGTLSGSAALTITTNGMLNLNGSSTKSLQEALTNAGIINWSGTGSLQIVNNGSSQKGALYNLAGAVFNIQNDQTLFNYDGPEFIYNAGLFRKLGSTNTSTINVIFTNTGTLDSQSGLISLTGTRSLARGTLNFGISGPTNFGRINLAGAAALTGTVSANLNNGYVPITNNSFAVLTFGSVSGIFTNTMLPFADAWQTNYTATNFILTVLNARPVLSPVATQTVSEWNTLTVTNPATDFDVPTQSLAFSLAAAPKGMNIGANSGILTWTPGQTNSPSTNSVTVVVTDNGVPSLSISNSYLVIVQEVNITPVPPNIATQTVNAVTLLTVSNTAFETNIHAVLSYVLVSPPAGAGITTNGIFTWSPLRSQGPNTNIVTTIVTSTDAYDLINPQLTATNSFTVIVYAPTLLPIGNYIVNAGQTISFTATATDNDPTRTLTYTVTSGPGTIGSGSGLFNWRPPVASAGTSNTVQVTVTDNSVPSLSDSKMFSIIINPLAPVMLTALGYANGQFTLGINGSPGPDYVIFASTNLMQWSGISTNLSPATPFQFNDPAAGGSRQRYYRVKLAP